MCLSTCLLTGSCPSTLVGRFEVTEDGKKFSWLSPGKTEWRSKFKGDCDWEFNPDGSVTLREFHKIELHTMAYLINSSQGSDLGGVTRWIQSKLNNAEIYASLVYGRIQSLLRRGWVKRGGYGYVITDIGVRSFADAASVRF